MSANRFEVPESITAHGAEVSDQVAAIVRALEVRQAREGAAALDSTLHIVPRPLRPLVKKVLGL